MMVLGGLEVASCMWGVKLARIRSNSVFVTGHALFFFCLLEEQVPTVIQILTINRILFSCLPGQFTMFVLQGFRKIQFLCVAADFCSVLYTKQKIGMWDYWLDVSHWDLCKRKE